MISYRTYRLKLFSQLQQFIQWFHIWGKTASVSVLVALHTTKNITVVKKVSKFQSTSRPLGLHVCTRPSRPVTPSWFPFRRGISFSESIYHHAIMTHADTPRSCQRGVIIFWGFFIYVSIYFSPLIFCWRHIKILWQLKTKREYYSITNMNDIEVLWRSDVVFE